jgi:hypothetical protein
MMEAELLNRTGGFDDNMDEHLKRSGCCWRHPCKHDRDGIARQSFGYCRSIFWCACHGFWLASV